MSMSSILVRNLATELKGSLGLGLRAHGHEIIIGAIMTAISVGIVIAASGDIGQAFAHARGR